MKIMNIVTCLGALSVGIATSNPALAEDNCWGNTVSFGNIDVIIENDPSVPSHLAIGRCQPTGDTSSRCTYKDKDQEEWTVVTEYVAGDPHWTWRALGGTGKWKDMNRSGWIKRVRSEGDVVIYAWGGNCKPTARKE